MNKILSFLFICLVFIGCKKKSTIHITAKNAVTGKPYPGLKYAIVRSKTGAFENHYKTVASGKLDENGEAYITKRFSKNWSHSITLQRPDNYCYANKLHYYFSGGENVEANFEYAECGYLQQDIININCEGSTDTFSIRDKYIYTDWTGWTDLAGCFSNTGGGYTKVPAGTRIFQWTVKRLSGTTSGLDTIVIEEGSYETLTIHY